MVKKKKYVKPTIKKHAMFMQRGGFIGLGKDIRFNKKDL